MSFEIEETDDDFVVSYDEDTEAILLVDMPGDWFNTAYDAFCSECNEKIDMRPHPKHCPQCGRVFVDMMEA